MTLVIFTCMLAACSAARLEHLEQQQSRYLPPAQSSSNSPSEDTNQHSAIGADTSAISASDIDQPGSSARASLPGNFQKPLPSDVEPASSDTDSEFAGYFYGPGIQSTNNQKVNNQASNQFGNQSPNKQFGQQRTNNYSSQQNQTPLFNSQGPRQQFGQQPFNQQYVQPAQNYRAASQFGYQDAIQQGTNNFRAQAQFQPQSTFAKSPSQSPQNYPQQSFDEETGYHY